ncbi:MULTISPECIES: hypothetical protein [unclassified Mesorhizobium]|uniref:hypothetical protein n=1 Tax=unclassified Mesorhizobium TaxID=325217 RepID=UPI00333C4945
MRRFGRLGRQFGQPDQCFAIHRPGKITALNDVLSGNNILSGNVVSGILNGNKTNIVGGVLSGLGVNLLGGNSYRLGKRH